MDLMQNKILQFDDITLSGITLKNYTEMYKIPPIPEKYYTEEHRIPYEVKDDSFVEGLAFELWGDSNYWDILLTLNNMTSLYDLPKSYDTVLEEAELRYQKWLEIAPLIKYYSEDELEQERLRILQETEADNEKYRIIYYVSMDDLSEIISYINEEKNNIRLDSDLIVTVQE
jgi:preprotein translocase subunit Sec61beta